MSVAMIILAAGQSHRMGDVNKLLAPVAGKPMLRHVAEHALETKAGPVFVITGHEAGRVETALYGLAVRFVENKAYESGLASSVRCGIGHLPDSATAALILLGDMPLIKAKTMKKLVAAFGRDHDAVVPVYAGQRGNPVLWSRSMFARLLSLRGDEGARKVLLQIKERVRYLDVDDPGVLIDADDPAALAQLEARLP